MEDKKFQQKSRFISWCSSTNIRSHGPTYEVHLLVLLLNVFVVFFSVTENDLCPRPSNTSQSVASRQCVSQPGSQAVRQPVTLPLDCNQHRKNEAPIPTNCHWMICSFFRQASYVCQNGLNDANVMIQVFVSNLCSHLKSFVFLFWFVFANETVLNH